MRTDRSDIFLGRQPILDREQRLVAYELLYRNSAQEKEALVTDDLLATARVIKHAFHDLGISTVVGESRAFVNVCAESLMSRVIETLPQDRVVLEILETVEVDDRIVQRCRQLKAKGYRLALDDFCRFNEAHEPLLDIVDVVKIDLTLVEPGGLRELVRRLKLRPARLLAEKVDSAERARECLALGLDMFQGFFFSQPVVLTS